MASPSSLPPQHSLSSPLGRPLRPAAPVFPPSRPSAPPPPPCDTAAAAAPLTVPSPATPPVVFVSLGGLFFLAFLAAALCCCLRKKKKKEKKKAVEEDKVVSSEDHVHVHETVVPGPHGEQLVALCIDEDIKLQEVKRKHEAIAEASRKEVGGERPPLRSAVPDNGHRLLERRV
ncbi:wiskott-Aldrich syndrome protein homolog 1-like [Ananas comosus]|uniref:Wiskott-Aldrich syndrome protein homolog 1-like n=1 Tax=Ananas comosus TaxID=4615 RepID=A0A6P5FG57_ANACO|nr:wiskott-Aldrich syndrome protein homolog 1-like [Ananas comosus]